MRPMLAEGDHLRGYTGNSVKLNFSIKCICSKLQTRAELLPKLEKIWDSDERYFIITFNSEMGFTLKRDMRFQQAVDKANVFIPDSVGIVLACRLLSGKNLERYPGIELVDDLLRLASGREVFILGAKPDVIEDAYHKIAQRYPNINLVGYHHGYFGEGEEPEVVSVIRRASPEILLVGMGSPRQEIFISKYFETLSSVKVAIGVGGTFDVLSGRQARAPEVWRKLNLEWLYRTIKQPSRIKRWVKLIGFMGYVLEEFISSRR